MSTFSQFRIFSILIDYEKKEWIQSIIIIERSDALRPEDTSNAEITSITEFQEEKINIVFYCFYSFFSFVQYSGGDTKLSSPHLDLIEIQESRDSNMYYIVPYSAILHISCQQI